MTDTIDARLAKLGLNLPDAPAPAANYVPYVQTGNQLYVSGQISAGPDGFITGKLGADMAAEATPHAGVVASSASLTSLDGHVPVRGLVYM